MLNKRNLIFLCLLILGVFLITSCLPKPPVTEGILKGQVIVPEGSKQLTGQALAEATVNIIDPVTGDIIATTTTDANGYYQVFVPAGGPYLLQAVKNNVKVQQFTPQVEVGIEYDLGTADCSTTAVALIVQAMLDAEDFPNDPADINLADIEADPDFNDVMSIVCSTIEAGEDPSLSAVVQQAVEDFLSPPAPPAPAPTPTYTVTYDGNGSTGGTVPSDANNYEQGDSVTVLGNTGDLEKTQDGISLLFTGWNTAADGSGTDYNEADTFSMGSANVTLYAQWSVLRGTGPAGGLIFYDKGSVSDGWRYLESAPSSTEWSWIEWGSYGTLIGGTETGIGTGKNNTTTVVTWLNSHSETGKAAQLCDALGEGETYDDWFLPSKEELNLMYENLHYIGTPVGGFAASSYWSSSEYDACDAWSQRFDNGHPTNDSKSLNTKRVRAVRAFRSTAPTYIVNYNANGSTGGTVPSDGYHYEQTETVMVLNNTGSLVKTGYTFDGWNTAANGSGTDQAVGSTFNMGSENVTLYAKWTIDHYVNGFTGSDVTGDGSFGNPWLTIQHALDNAPSGGTIYVADGIYTENIIFPYDKVIVLKSENGAEFTTINGGGDISSVVRISGCPDGTTLDGFTITGGNSTSGAGIYIYNSWPTIQNNTISGNTASTKGGGIYMEHKSPTIQNNTISGNTASYGGGIYIEYGSPTIKNNTISGNTASYGGGIYIPGSAFPIIGGSDGSATEDFNTICGNTPDQINPDIYHNNYIFTNCDVIGETGPAGGLIFYDKGEVSDGWRYLEAAPASTESTLKQWGSMGTLIGGTGLEIGDGQSNTTTIVTWLNNNTDDTYLCDALVTNEVGYAVCDDWFLPSKDELDLMYTNLKVAGIGGFVESDTHCTYWSSSEHDADEAWYQDFYNGDQSHYYDKNSCKLVRAARAF
jgi:uncharacterized repeat protein (TIGR02543 family)